MSSANNTLGPEDGTSSSEKNSPPTSTSVLDKSRSLFGNSSSVLSTAKRDATPDAQSGETNSVNDPVAMDADVTETPNAVDVDMQDGQDEPMDSADSTDPPAQDNDEVVNQDPEPVVEEEVFEKKVVSMDTSRNEEEEEEEEEEKAPEPMETGDNGEEKVEADDVEIDGEDEVDEAPVKKIKRAVVSEDDEDEGSQDADEPAEEQSPEPVEEDEQAEKPTSPVEAEEEPVAEPENYLNNQEQEQPEPIEANESEESASLVIDESADRSIEEEVAPETDSTAEAETVEEPEQPEAEEEPSEQPTEEEEKEQEEQPETSSRRSRGRRSAASASTPAASTTPRRGRGRTSQAQVEKEAEEREEGEEEVVETPKKRGRSTRGKKEEVEEVVDDAPEEEPVDEEVVEEAPKRGRGRRSAPAVQPDAVEEELVEAAPKRGRGRRSAPAAQPDAVADDEPAEEAQDQQNEETETPRRGGRARRSVATPAAAPTPRSARGRGRKSNVVPEPAIEDGEEEQEVAAEPESARKTRTPRGKKTEPVAEDPEVEDEDAQEDAGEEEEEAAEESEAPTSSSRRPTRSRAAPKSTAAPPAKRTPARGGRRKQVSLTEEVIHEGEEPEETTPKAKKSAKSAPSSSKKTEFDPYDMETEMEHHPEPLKNIQMEVKSFGAVSYAKVGNSGSKYSSTEKAAESRVGTLSSGPSPKARSLADMTPGKEKVKHRMSMPTGRRSRGKKEEPEEAMEVEETEEQTTSSSTPATANRGKKRKSTALDTVTPAKKQAVPQLKEFTDEEQLQVDHPTDENEPHAPGARVYAVFNKMFYPARILAERDGLGRYKLQFVADNVVKDVPNSGIIPLRDIHPGKKAIYEEEEVGVYYGVKDVSAEEWFKGKLTIMILDEDGDATAETKVVDWSELSFDQAEWKDYIKTKEHNATAVVTSNITTMSEATRARKPVAVKVPTTRTRKPKTADIAASRGSSAQKTPEEEDEDMVLPMNEKGVGKSIFSGKIFMLTSANRTSATPISPMFKKKNLMQFISQNGGIVTEQLNDHLPHLVPLLISDTYYRTHKYLAALARGIPCVSNTWLQACGDEGECIDYKDFILPAGASLFDGKDKPAPKNPSRIFADKVIYVHSTHGVRENTQNGPGGTFIEIWKPILELLGATVIGMDWRTLHERKAKFDAVLADGTFREEVMDYANEIGASKVTSEWVIQAIILGELPDATAHEKFDPYQLHNRHH